MAYNSTSFGYSSGFINYFRPFVHSSTSDALLHSLLPRSTMFSWDGTCIRCIKDFSFTLSTLLETNCLYPVKNHRTFRPFIATLHGISVQSSSYIFQNDGSHMWSKELKSCYLKIFLGKEALTNKWLLIAAFCLFDNCVLSRKNTSFASIQNALIVVLSRNGNSPEPNIALLNLRNITSIEFLAFI